MTLDNSSGLGRMAGTFLWLHAAILKIVLFPVSSPQFWARLRLHELQLIYVCESFIRCLSLLVCSTFGEHLLLTEMTKKQGKRVINLNDLVKHRMFVVDGRSAPKKLCKIKPQKNGLWWLKTFEQIAFETGGEKWTLIILNSILRPFSFKNAIIRIEITWLKLHTPGRKRSKDGKWWHSIKLPRASDTRKRVSGDVLLFRSPVETSNIQFGRIPQKRGKTEKLY